MGLKLKGTEHSFLSILSVCLFIYSYLILICYNSKILILSWKGGPSQTTLPNPHSPWAQVIPKKMKWLCLHKREIFKEHYSIQHGNEPSTHGTLVCGPKASTDFSDGHHPWKKQWKQHFLFLVFMGIFFLFFVLVL